jgi:hypothetical protein
MEKRYNSLMKNKEDMAKGFDNEIKRLKGERDDLMKRLGIILSSVTFDCRQYIV